MKYYRCFNLRAGRCRREIFDQIVKMAPLSLLHYGDIEIEAKAGDAANAELVDRAVAFCEKNGLAWSDRGSNQGTYGYEMVRLHEAEDLINAKLLRLKPHANLIQLQEERDDFGRLLLIASKARPSRKIGRIHPNWIIVSDATRRTLTAGDFIGIEFGEVALKGKSINAAKEPFWELKSSLTLPKMANTSHFVTVGHVPFDGDYSKTVWIDDPPFRTGEIHYKNSELVLSGEFDIARTFEDYMNSHPALVVSQRFYQHCLKHKISLEVEPVRIDLD